MEGKNLWAKFGFVFVLLAVSVCAILVYGLKRGPDIAGGYSMIFEVENPANDSKMVEDIIGILKERVDPTGLSSIEWRPLGSSRFEVRMPETSDKSKKYRTEFNKNVETLLATNIERADIRTIMNTPVGQRDVKINTLVEGDKARAVAVKALIASIEKLNQTENTLADVKAQAADARNSGASRRKELQAKLLDAMKAQDEALSDYTAKLDAVRKGNISSRDLFSLFRGYDKAMAQNVDEKRSTAMDSFNDRAEMMQEDHPAQAGRLAALIALYKEWSEIKSPLEDPNDLKRMIRKSGVLEFRIVPFKPGYNSQSVLTQKQVDEYTRTLMDKGPDVVIANGDYVWMPLRDEGEKYDSVVVADAGGTKYMLLSNKPGETMLQNRKGNKTWQLDSSRASSDNFGKPAVNFTFDARGAKLFGILTSAHKSDPGTGREGMPMAILLDDEVYSAPRIQSTITSSGQITGNFSLQEVQELVRILKAGSLPGKVKPEPISESSFSAALGKVNIEKGIRSAIYGTMAVAVFMFIYYLLAGLVADVALMMNIILVLGAMSLLQAAMTLPGIAGVILTIGMAVDANVLIYERLREEQNRGLAIRQALKNAYERAFSAIFDSNITTLLICAFLYFVFGELGMGEVRGFAITLGLGVMFSMFTALVVTRWVFQLLMDTRILRKPIKMLTLVPIAKINWISKRYYFWTVSAALIITGIVPLAWQGSNIWGIEFSSGTQVMLILKDDTLLNGRLPQDEIVRASFGNEAGTLLADADDKLKLEIGKLSGTATRVEAKLADNRIGDFIANYGNDKGEVTLDDWKKKHKNIAFFEVLDKDRNGILSEVELQNLPQRTYQISTTSADVPLIRKVLNEAFGEAVERRVPCTYNMVKNTNIPQLGVKTADGGATIVTPALIKQASASVR
ncbi:MAG TPA: protein translocase subunit SecD, partial [Phycisphaerae bacterium]|nr:protein translocase subunit SecD [Phycisphaerae bacterium]